MMDPHPYSLALHPVQDHPGPVPEEFPGFPGYEIPEERDMVHRWLGSRQMAQTGQTTAERGAEEIPLVAIDLIPNEKKCRHRTHHRGKDRDSQSLQSPIHAWFPYISRRPERASAMVDPSTYSRSLPTGMPRASRVTLGPRGRTTCSR